MVFALLAIRGIQQHDIPVSAFILLYGVFLFDATFTLLRRVFSGQRWWEAHSTHLYQRAVRCGLGHARVTILAMLWSICLATFGTLEVLGVSIEVLWLPSGLALMFVAVFGVRFLERNVTVH
jgi:Fuc2NAc and GlcNAc transferase